jgi:membrane dipeptidase
MPDARDWARHVAHVIETVGPDHVAIGLDMVGGRSGVPRAPGGYGELLTALREITTAENVRKIAGENWFSVLADIERARGR